MKTPIFGPFDVSRSTNLSDNQLINLRPEIAESKGGKSIGALMGTAGLALLTTMGAGPMNGIRALGETLYAVSGLQVYSVATDWTATLVDTILGSGGRVSMIDNGTQLAIFTDTNGYIAPAGYPLTGATIGGNGGINFAIGNTAVMQATNGTQSAAVVIEVTGVKAGGAITSFNITQAGAFPERPSGLKQLSTTGSGSNLTLTSLVFGPKKLLGKILLPFTPQVGQTPSTTFQDGFGLLTQPGTQTFWQSINGDLSVWPALNFATATAESDNVMAVAEIHRLIFVVKQRSIEVWSDAGTSGFAFQPINSVLIEHGTPSWATVQRSGESLFLLSQSAEGQGIVREIVGFTPRRISTHPIETLINQASTLSDAFAFAYQQDGHQFYVLTVPAINLTFVYDKTESELAGMPIWHQWLSFSTVTGNFSRHWGNVFVFWNNTLILGDYRNGNIYRIDLATLTDNGAPRKWLRSWRALSQPVMQPMRFSSLQIDMQTGVNVGATINPEVMLEWSDDGGHNWSAQRIVLAGQTGETAKRVKFNRLGSTKRSAGLDRIFQLSSTDPFPVALIGAELDV